MANTLSRQEVKRFALIGAQSRLAELREEIASLVRAFPQLGKSTGTSRARAADAPAAAATKKRGRRRNFNMSAEQKQAVSDRMKKYWAARRKEKGKKA